MNVRRWRRVLSTFLIAAAWHPGPCDAAPARQVVPGAFQTPKPPYPLNARRDREQGFSLVRVFFGGTGKVTRIVTIQATGYPDLDESTVNYAQANWTGPANTAIRVPVEYRLTNFQSGNSPDETLKNGWYAPRAPYPHPAALARESGSGLVAVSTDATGKVVAVKIIRSTGSRRLDENTVNYGVSFWKGPPNATRKVAVSYALSASL